MDCKCVANSYLGLAIESSASSNLALRQGKIANIDNKLNCENFVIVCAGGPLCSLMYSFVNWRRIFFAEIELLLIVFVLKAIKWTKNINLL